MDAKQRRRLAAGEQLGDGLVGEDHQLLDERVRGRFADHPHVGDAVVGERDLELAADDLERAARGPARAEGGGDPLRVVEGLAERVVGSGQDPLDVGVREAPAGDDLRAVERRAARARARRRTGSRR